MPLPTKANVTRPEAHGYDALIEYGPDPGNSLYLRLAVGPGRQMRFQTVDAEEQGPRTAVNPEDMRAESGVSFSRSRFSGGEGLDQAHRPNGSDRDSSRFWNSRNIDVTPSKPGEPEELKLLRGAASLRTVDVGGVVRMPIVRVGTTIFTVADDATLVDWSSDPTAVTPFWTQDTPGGSGDIKDLTGLGDEVYAARANIRKRDSGGGWALWSDLNASRLWSAKGRVIAADNTGDALYEARSGAGSVLLHTLASGETWNDVADVGGAILAAASDGYVYAFVEEGGELSLKGQTRLEGEIPTALGFAEGLVFIGTAEPTTAGGQVGRLWRAFFVGLRLREAQVIRTWGDGSATLDHAPQRIISTREAVWTALIEDGSETHVWRYHLETAGLARDLVLGASSVVHGLAIVDDRAFAGLHTSGIWREATTYASSGYLIGPLGDLYNAAAKAWIGARLHTGEVPTGTQVVLAYSTNPAAIDDAGHASWTDIITATPAAPGQSAESAITAVESRYIVGKLTLTPNGGQSATPTVLAFAFRGLGLPTETDFAVPVNVSDRLELPNRKPQTYNGVGDAVYDGLKDIEGKVVTLTLLRPDESVIGQLRSVSTPIEEIPRRGSPTTYALVTVRGQRQ